MVVFIYSPAVLIEKEETSARAVFICTSYENWMALVSVPEAYAVGCIITKPSLLEKGLIIFLEIDSVSVTNCRFELLVILIGELIVAV